MDLPTNPSALIDLLRAWFFAKDRSIVMANDTFIEGDEISTPGNPASGRRRLYAKGDCWYDLNSSGTETSLCGSGPEYVIIQDQKASGTNGGTFTSGAWRTRTLNTTVLNTISTGYSLAANQFILPSGDYILIAWLPGREVNYHPGRLQNITDGTTTINGFSSAFNRQGSPFDGDIWTQIIGAFSITASKTFEIQHRCSTTKATTGFGFRTGTDSGFAVGLEIYTTVMIWKR